MNKHWIRMNSSFTVLLLELNFLLLSSKWTLVEYLLCPSNLRMIVSRKVFWGATWPRLTGMLMKPPPVLTGWNPSCSDWSVLLLSYTEVWSDRKVAKKGAVGVWVESHQTPSTSSHPLILSSSSLHPVATDPPIIWIAVCDWSGQQISFSSALQTKK